MNERAEGLIPFEFEFTWQHPDNNCFMKEVLPIIKDNITGYGITQGEALKQARVVAENSPKFCDSCRQNYRFTG